MSAWRRLLDRMVEIRAGEGRQVALMFAFALCLGAARGLISAAWVAIFFARFDATTLPYVYLASAAVVAAGGYAYSALQGRLAFARLQSGTLLVVAAYLGLLRLALAGTGAAWPAFGVAISYEVVWVLTGLVYWGLAGRLFDVRQAKRLYGFIGSGEVIATVLASAAVPALVAVAGTAELVTAATAAVVMGWAFLTYILRTFGRRLAAADEQQEQKTGAPDRRLSGGGSRNRLRDRYLLLMVAFGALCQLTYYLVDTGYVSEANAHFPSEAALAGFVGVLNALTYAATFVTQVGVVAPLLRRFGVRYQLLVTPLSVGIGCAAVALLGNLAGPLPAVFWLVCATRLMMEVDWNAMYGPAKLILLQPLPARRRLWSQAIVEGIGEPVGQGLAGAALLGYALLVPFNGVTLASLTLPVCLVFGVVGVLAGRQYVVALRAAVAKRFLGETSLSYDDPATRALLERGLESEQPGQVLYCLGKLEEIGDPALGRHLTRLVGHQAPEVREDALNRIERLRNAEAVSVVRAQLDTEQIAAVRAAAARALCALDPSAAFARVGPLLDDLDPLVQAGALVGLLRYGSATAHAAADARLRQLGGSPSVEDRILAAEAAGQLGAAAAAGLLPALLRDEAATVRRAALAAAGELGLPSFSPAMVDSLVTPGTRGAALAAIVGAGREIVPFLDSTLRQERLPIDVRCQLLKACGRLGGAAAMSVLWREVQYPHAEVRLQALRALDSCAHDVAGEQPAEVGALLRQEVSLVAWALATQQALAESEGIPRHLLTALGAEVDLARERSFLLVALVYDRATITRAYAGFTSELPEQRANAVELLDNVLAQENKRLVLPLVEVIEPAERLRRLRALLLPENEPHTRDARLIDVLARPPHWLTPWTKASALHTMGLLGSMTFLEPVVAGLRSPDALVRETAIWALGRLRPDGLAQTLSTLTEDAAGSVSTIAREVLARCS